MARLQVGQKFDCWEDLFLSVEEHCQTTLQPFRKSNSRMCATLNKTMAKGRKKYPEEKVYVFNTFKCIHNWNTHTDEHGKLVTRTPKPDGCQATIHAMLDKARTKIELVKLDERHNHELYSGPDALTRLPKIQPPMNLYLPVMHTTRQELKSPTKCDIKNVYSFESSNNLSSQLNSTSSSSPCTSSTSNLVPLFNSKVIEDVKSSPIAVTKRLSSISDVDESQTIAVSQPKQKCLITSLTSQPTYSKTSQSPPLLTHKNVSVSQSSTQQILEQVANHRCESVSQSVDQNAINLHCNSTNQSASSNDIASFLAYLKKNGEEDRELRKQEIELRKQEIEIRQRECLLREKEVELEKQRFEFDRSERNTLLDLLKIQLVKHEVSEVADQNIQYAIIVKNDGE